MARYINADKFLDKLLYMGYMDEQKSEVEEVANNMIEEAISKAEYENRLKADLKAILVELQLEIEELDSRAGYDGNGMPTFSTDYIRKKKVNEIIQQQIDKLKGVGMEVTIDKCCTSKETYTINNIISIMENLLYDMRNSDGGEGALILDGQKFYTDAGFALEGVEIFIKLFKQRMGVEENVDTIAEQTENS